MTSPALSSPRRSATGRVLRQTAGIALSLAATFLGLLLVTFLIARVVPIDPAHAILGERASAEQIAELH